MLEAVVETDKVEVPDGVVGERERLAGLREEEGPVGTKATDRVTRPVKPLSPFTIIVDVPNEPTGTMTKVGLADMVKSVTVTDSLTDRTKDPAVPVTVTV